MDEKARERLIREISDILEIPEIGDVLRQKILELKAMATKFRGAFIPAPLPENRAPSKLSDLTPGVEFDLALLGNNLWIPSLPSDPGRTDVSDVISQSMLDYIGEQSLNKKTPHFMARGLRFPGHEGRVFDMVLEMIEPAYIRGVIHGRVDKHPDVPAVNEPAKADPGDSSENMNERQLLQLVFRYMADNKDFYNYVASEFLYHWKPFLDQQSSEPQPKSAEE